MSALYACIPQTQMHSPDSNFVVRKKLLHEQESGLLHSSYLEIARVTCAALYLYYLIVVELSL